MAQVSHRQRRNDRLADIFLMEDNRVFSRKIEDWNTVCSCYYPTVNRRCCYACGKYIYYMV